MADGGISLALAGLSAAASAGGAVMGGMAGKDAANQKAEQALRAAEYGKIQAAQADQSMRKQLEFTMGNIEAVRAAAGADPNSPTGAALTSYVQDNGDKERETKVRNVLRQVSENERAVSFYQKQGQQSMLGGLLSGVGSLAKSASGMSFGGGGGGGYATAPNNTVGGLM